MTLNEVRPQEKAINETFLMTPYNQIIKILKYNIYRLVREPVLSFHLGLIYLFLGTISSRYWPNPLVNLCLDLDLNVFILIQSFYSKEIYTLKTEGFVPKKLVTFQDIPILIDSNFWKGSIKYSDRLTLSIFLAALRGFNCIRHSYFLVQLCS